MKLEGRIRVLSNQHTWGLKDENQKTRSRKEHYRTYAAPMFSPHLRLPAIAPQAFLLAKTLPLFGQPQMCYITYMSVFTLCSAPFQSTNVSMQEFSVYKNRQTSSEVSFPTRRHPWFRSINFYNTKHTISSATESYSLDFCSLVRPSFAIQKMFWTTKKKVLPKTFIIPGVPLRSPHKVKVTVAFCLLPVYSLVNLSLHTMVRLSLQQAPNHNLRITTYPPTWWKTWHTIQKFGMHIFNANNAGRHQIQAGKARLLLINFFFLGGGGKALH